MPTPDDLASLAPEVSALIALAACPACRRARPSATRHCLWCGHPPRLQARAQRAGNAAPPATSEERPIAVVTRELEPAASARLLQRRPRRTDVGLLRGSVAALRLATLAGPFALRCLPQLRFEPRDYQLEAALRTLGELGGSAILADEVGLGKTIEAGLVLKELSLRGLLQSALILVPASLLDQWRVELQDKFELQATVIDRPVARLPPLAIMSHQRARSRRFREQLRARFWDLVIVDEAQALRNSATQLYRFVYELQRRYTVLLTATPLQNELLELFNLISLARPGFFRSRRYFARRYMRDRRTARNPDELRELCRQVMIRHRRADTLAPIPPRRVQSVIVEPGAEERELYQLVLRWARLAFARSIGVYDPDQWPGPERYRLLLLLSLLVKESTSSPSAVLSTLEGALLPRVRDEELRALALRIIELGRGIGLTAKLSALGARLDELAGERCVIYSEYHATLARIEQYLRLKGVSVTPFHGRLSASARRAALARFAAEGGVLLSSEVGGQGLNLQHCHQLINYDLPWNPMRVEQRIGRLHRFGQAELVEVVSLINRGTYEEFLLDLLLRKIRLFERVVGEIDSILAYVADGAPFELRLGLVLLEAADDEQAAARFDQLAAEVASAEHLYDEDRQATATILDFPGGGPARGAP